VSYQYEARITPESQEASSYAMRGTFGFEFELLIPFTACDSYEAI